MSEQTSCLSGDNNMKIQQVLDEKARKSDNIRRILPYVGLMFIFAFFLIVTKGRLINQTNLADLINQSFTLMIVAIGASFVYAHRRC